MSFITKGNITWNMGAVGEPSHPDYPKVGTLSWVGQIYNIIEVRDQSGEELSFWLDKGIRLWGSSGDEQNPSGGLETYIRRGATVFKQGDRINLGDQFDASFLSSNSYSRLIPPECRIPIEEDVYKFIKNQTDIELLKLLNFVDESGNDIYTGPAGEEDTWNSKRHRFWINWEHGGHFFNSALFGRNSEGGGAVRRYTSWFNGIERIRVKYANCYWTGNNLNVSVDKDTAHSRFLHGTTLQTGDWEYAETYDRKRPWWGWWILDNYDFRRAIYPMGFYDRESSIENQEGFAREFFDWISDTDNIGGTRFWNTLGFVNYTVPISMAVFYMLDFLSGAGVKGRFWRPGPSPEAHFYSDGARKIPRRRTVAAFKSNPDRAGQPGNTRQPRIYAVLRWLDPIWYVNHFTGAATNAIFNRYPGYETVVGFTPFASLISNTFVALSRVVDHIRAWVIDIFDGDTRRLAWFDYQYSDGLIDSYPQRLENPTPLNLGVRSTFMNVMKLAATAVIGGFRRDNFRWAELRCILDAEPPDTPEEVKNEYPDPIFFSSGY